MFFQNVPPEIDLCKDKLAPLKSKLSCQQILMARSGGKIGDISGPKDTGIRHVYVLIP